MATEKTRKPPKMFRKPIPEKKFTRKILKRIYVTKEREFLLSLMKQDAEGRYSLPGELSKADAKRLKVLAKSIRKNKGLVTGWKAALLLFIIGGTVLFNLLLKNRLAEKGLESGLEAVFQARADVEGTRVSLLAGAVSFDSMTVADKSRPMENLFELARTELKLNTWELLKKRVVIERAACSNIAFGTPRTESGALPGNVSAGNAENSGGNSAGTSGLGGLLADTDPAALLESQKERLASLPYIESVNAEYRAALEKWPQKIDSLNTDLAQGKKAAEKIAAIKVGSIDTLEEATAALKVIEENAPAVEQAGSSVQSAGSDFNRDMKRLKALQEGIGDAVKQDYALLESMVADPGGELKGIASQAAENLLRARIGGYFDQARKLIAAAGNLSSGKARKAAVQKRREGAVVQFPVTGYPRFLIREFHVSYGSAGSEPYVELDASGITSQPDVWGRPTEFSWQAAGDGLSVSGEGILDLRSDAEDSIFSIKAELQGGSFDAGDSLAGLGLTDLKGGAGGSMNFSVYDDGRGAGTAEIRLNALKPVFSQKGDLLTDAVREVLAGTGEARFSVSFKAEGDRLTEFQVRSDLDRVLSSRVGDYLQARGEKLKEELRTALQNELADSLARNDTLQASLGDYADTLNADLREAESMQDLAESQKEAVNRKIEEIRSKAEQEARQQAEKLLEGAGKKLKLPF